MSFQPGDRVGTYEILSTLGAGGMGVVYRARDSTLGREVALKTLPEAVASDPERLARFEREARVLASLNHTNVATVYGFSSAALLRPQVAGEAPDGTPPVSPESERAEATHFLTMELVEGETLEDRIARGPIPPAQALPLFIQIAQGLEAAHAKGIVHRDLKPANIKVGPVVGGSSQVKPAAVKILDFGLAKALAPDGEAMSTSVSHSPTLTMAATMRGEILGTAAYMSPEQAQGEAADHRADIWAFGVCLLEALTGKRVFDGANHSFVLASVLKDQPDLDALPPSTPPQVRRLLRRCLEKDRDRRLRDVADARLELEEALATPAGDHAAAAAARAPRLWMGVAAGVGIALGAVAGWLVPLLLRSAPEPAPLARFVLNAPPNEPAGRSPGPGLAISPDGSTVVYLTGLYPSTTAQVRRIDQLEGAPLAGMAPGVLSPFFSPDGKWIGYFHDSGRSLRKVSVLGGPSVTLAKIDQFPAGASWGPDDTIVFGRETAGLQRVAAAGGEPREVTQLAEGESSHRFPDVLPDGKTVLFAAFTGPDADDAVISVVSLETGERGIVVSGGSQPRYVPSGHVVYSVGATLRAVPFDLRRLEATGEAVPVVEGVAITGMGAAKYSVSANGTLTYMTGTAQGLENVLVWVDREGREEAIGAPPRSYVYPRLSPDGTRIALDVRAQDEDIWIWDLERETLTRLTFSPETDAGPVWSPDGRTVFFGSAQKETGWDIFSRLADGTGGLTRHTEAPGLEAPASVTPDGAGLVAVTGPGPTGPFDILLVDISGATEPTTLLEADFNLANAELSPDGRWMSYESDESGASEIFVRPFPALDSGRWQVSTGGGTRPLWSRDGREIFYLDPAGHLIAASVQLRGDSPAFGRPVALIERGYANPRTGRTYDVSPDGRRFLMIKANVQQEEEASRQIVLVENWLGELRRLAPARR